MFKKLIYPLFLLLIGYILFFSSDAKIIIAGIAIFIVGMIFMEDGFKLFSGGMLEKALKKSTSSLPKAIASGFVATAIVQSSSLISVIVISFLSAELITLSGAIGIIFGSNIGTTTTAWIVSSFGVKIEIAQLAMSMVIFGVILKLHSHKTYQGIGMILLGLGFVFLGIAYMKEGFETLRNGLHLAEYAIEGSWGILVYVFLGAMATVIIQSSSATMALIITALATQQILYINALELAIGANIGTTVTAVMGAMTSNTNGKRLALAHFIFNMFTAFIAIVFLYQLSDFVDYLSYYVDIGESDYAMKLALFHTLFNVIGVLAMVPFIGHLERFLKTKFKNDKKEVLRAKYLNESITEVPEAAIIALEKEISYLYNSVTEILYHGLSLHRHKCVGIDFGEDYCELPNIVKNSVNKIEINVDEFYDRKIKTLYGEILHFATISQEKMSQEEQYKVYMLKIASRDIVEILKDVKELQKNTNRYIKSSNSDIKKQYNTLREEIVKTLDGINMIENSADDFDVYAKLSLLESGLEKLDMIKNGRIDTLIRNNKIEPKMASSLMNDSAFAYDISKKLIHIATILWIEDREIQELGEM
jgi:phosphate:Na+ symporter